MVIEASEDLEVVKSFDELGLREELLRGKLIFRLTLIRNLRLRIQQAFSSSAKSYLANHQGQRCDRLESEWNW
jgi:hypothetical protein